MPLSKRSRLSVIISLLGLLAVASGLLVVGVVHQAHAAQASLGSPFVRQITVGGTTSINPTAPGKDLGVQTPEINTKANGLGGDAKNNVKQFQGTNRSAAIHQSTLNPAAQGSTASGSGKELLKSFNGINHRDQRLASGGNQFSLEPPDQGLCVGNGFVMETVNDALAVYDSNGNILKAVTALNAFYGYPPSIDRTTGVFGPEITDPSCYYDAPTHRWFHIVLTLDTVSTSGAFTGTNHIDIAVSTTSSPLGSWVIYHLPTQDDGTQGTPNHNCDGGPCLGDYPHLGADANGFYVTTNEYGFFATGLGFHAAQIYAFSKQALASNAATVAVTQFDTIGTVGQPGGLPVNPGFTVWPATSPGKQYAASNNGTEYFMSSDAAPEANGNGASRDLIVWSITNTASLNTTSPGLVLSNAVLTINPYSIPALATQKNGNAPLLSCLNTPSCATAVIGGADPFTEVLGPTDVNDTRMQQVTFADGKLWGALDTSVTVNNVNEAGVEWFIVNPVTPKVLKQGYLGGKNANLTYPAIGVNEGGKGVMAFTLVGPNNFPSAAYASIDNINGV
ncbi:MAG: hypothetical protein ACXVBU_17300, partial [Ktedonobacteraceae bacterium]